MIQLASKGNLAGWSGKACCALCRDAQTATATAFSLRTASLSAASSVANGRSASVSGSPFSSICCQTQYCPVFEV